jgi:hypothetical protein
MRGLQTFELKGTYTAHMQRRGSYSSGWQIRLARKSLIQQES